MHRWPAPKAQVQLRVPETWERHVRAPSLGRRRPGQAALGQSLVLVGLCITVRASDPEFWHFPAQMEEEGKQGGGWGQGPGTCKHTLGKQQDFFPVLCFHQASGSTPKSRLEWTRPHVGGWICPERGPEQPARMHVGGEGPDLPWLSGAAAGGTAQPTPTHSQSSGCVGGHARHAGHGRMQSKPLPPQLSARCVHSVSLSFVQA